MANMLFRRPGHGVGDQVVMIGIMLVERRYRWGRTLASCKLAS